MLRIMNSFSANLQTSSAVEATEEASEWTLSGDLRFDSCCLPRSKTVMLICFNDKHQKFLESYQKIGIYECILSYILN